MSTKLKTKPETHLPTEEENRAWSEQYDRVAATPECQRLYAVLKLAMYVVAGAELIENELDRRVSALHGTPWYSTDANGNSIVLAFPEPDPAHVDELERRLTRLYAILHEEE